MQDLLDQWNKQKGICPYTGWTLHLDKNKHNVSNRGKVFRASLDRKDNNLGYTKENIQWVSIVAQHSKHTLNETDFIFFCIDVVNTYANS